MLFGGDPELVIVKIRELTIRLDELFAQRKLKDFEQVLDQRRGLLESISRCKPLPMGYNELLQQLYDREQEWFAQADIRMNYYKEELHGVAVKRRSLKGLSKAYVPVGHVGTLFYRSG